MNLFKKEATEVLNNLSRSPLIKLCLMCSLTLTVLKFYYEEISIDTCNPISSCTSRRRSKHFGDKPAQSTAKLQSLTKSNISFVFHTHFASLRPPFGAHTIAKACDWGRMAVESGRDSARPFPTYKYRRNLINLG